MNHSSSIFSATLRTPGEDEEERGEPESTFKPKCSARLNAGTITAPFTTDDIIAMGADLEEKQDTIKKRVQGMSKEEAKKEKDALKPIFEKIQNYYTRALVTHFTRVRQDEKDEQYGPCQSFLGLYNEINGVTDSTDEAASKRKRKKRRIETTDLHTNFNTEDDGIDNNEMESDNSSLGTPENDDIGVIDLVDTDEDEDNTDDDRKVSTLQLASLVTYRILPLSLRLLPEKSHHKQTLLRATPTITMRRDSKKFYASWI